LALQDFHCSGLQIPSSSGPEVIIFGFKIRKSGSAKAITEEQNTILFLPVDHRYEY
jgi:hypothetical protein